MPQRSNWFQRLVHTLESRFVRDGFAVTESKMLPDLTVDGLFREVDIVLEGHAADHPVTIGVECRGGGHRADITWVDSMVGKHSRLRIHTTVLVSRAGFTKSALKYCEKWGIETITFNEDNLPDWSRFIERIMQTTLQLFFGPSIRTISLVVDGAQHSHGVTGETSLQSPSDKKARTLGNIAREALDDRRLKHRAMRITGGDSKLVTSVSIPIERGSYVLDDQETKLVVTSIVVEAECHSEVSDLEVHKGNYRDTAVAYAERDKDIPVRILVTEQAGKTPDIACLIPASDENSQDETSPTAVGVTLNAGESRSSPAKFVTFLPNDAYQRRDVEITKKLRKTYLRPFKIRAIDVHETVKRAESIEIFEITSQPGSIAPGDGGTDLSQSAARNPFCYFTRRINSSYGIVVECYETQGILRANCAFKVPAALYGTDSNPSPLTLMRRLAEAYGLEIKLGSRVAKFIFAESIPVSNKFKVQLFEHVRRDRTWLGSLHHRRRAGYLDFAICYAIDLENYRRAIVVNKTRNKRGRARR